MERGRRSPWPVKQGELFPHECLLHFTHHKCLTIYHQRVLEQLAKEFGFMYATFASQSQPFHEHALNGWGKRMLTLSDRPDEISPHLRSFKASHFVRDPRDLVVSGYYYHRWTQEEWCTKPNFQWTKLVGTRSFGYFQPDSNKYPRNESYQAYLNTLDTEAGMLLELFWRKYSFEFMRRWDFAKPHFLEMRYEDIVGNERAAFARLFAHYGFHPRVAERGLELVNDLRLANQSQGKGTHLRSGAARQWEQEFTPRVRDVFKEQYGALLVRLGYERDLNW